MSGTELALWVRSGLQITLPHCMLVAVAVVPASADPGPERGACPRPVKAGTARRTVPF